MGFTGEGMSQEKGAPFRDVCRVVAGLTGSTADSLLVTLPSELTFNDLRDAGRRHSKAEKTLPHNVHCIAHKSATGRCAGGKTLEISAEDWSAELKSKHVKSTVFTCRATGKDLGVSAEGLTKHKSSSYTKPHILCQRQELMRLLSETYNKDIRKELENQEDRNDVLLNVYKSLWMSKLVPQHVFVSWKNGEEESSRSLVLGSGPYAVRILPLVKYGPNQYTFDKMEVPRCEIPVGGIHDIVISFAEPLISHDQLGWSQTSDWMGLPLYVADHSLLSLPRSMVSQLCSALGLKHTRLDYRSRVKLFLEHMQKSPDFINDILEEIPEAESKSKAKNADETRLLLKLGPLDFLVGVEPPS